MQIDDRIAQLLCSRLCHDLAGPAGAVNTGMELIGEAENPISPENAQTMDFVMHSARQVTDRLAFYRLAFGFAGRGGAPRVAVADACRLIESFIDRSRIDVRWDCPDGDLTSDQIRMVFTMILMALGCLPRGGRLLCGFGTIEDGFGVAMTASGEGARLSDDDRAALDMNVPVDRLSARNVHVRWGALVAANMGGAIEIDGPAEGAFLAKENAEVRLAVLLIGS
ncbi:histidine phosphotransferase family protein [Varunaivibrio sulfuroxidans]|uniref:Histidine phosphotransferase ChpT n=1 Tax=Varunaivibrio sulfuroxidans TaxID=1773489 RepID=A0A4R3JBR9_9PROT|nr:histidine phosphotransferase family protein [Varunaivibrio sulfuroxidans]TCS63479.1 histidine phosphotransferase ChpT [Varunaivibrio sulfuroxidans]WES30376.1 histidine phosphotransferase family protein [Varunaivibrio sulfuroxidans]